METVTLETPIDMNNKIIAIPANTIKVAFNIRYGWDESKILDAYKSGIAELEDSIRTWGFKPNEPLEVYDSGVTSEEGLTIYNLAEGHRRFAAVQSILSQDPDYNFGNGLANGEVWVFISPKPATILDLLASQFDANKSQSNTRLDTAKAIYTAIESGEVKGKKTAIYPQIGERIAGLKSWQSVETFYNVYQLPDEVKDWIQESELNEDLPVALSFSTAGEIVTYYKVPDTSKLLVEALNRATKNPESVKTFGNKVLKSWLHELAVELKLGKKPPAPSKKDEEVTQKVEQDSISPTITDQSENKEYTPDEVQAQSDIHPVTPDTAITPSQPANTKPTPATEKPAKPSVPPASSIDRVKSLVLKTLAEQAGSYIVEGRSDVDSGKFIIELPVDIGENLAELVSSLIDPNSNPPSEISAVTAVEDMEF